MNSPKVQRATEMDEAALVSMPTEELRKLMERAIDQAERSENSENSESYEYAVMDPKFIRET